MSSSQQDFYEAHLAEQLEAGRAWTIGDDHWLSKYSWAPDRELNPQYVGVPDIEWAGVQVWHRRSDGALCSGAVQFDVPGIEVLGDRPRWQVESFDPLTLSPSVLCRAPLDAGGECGDHGFIRNGRWVRA